MTVARKMRARPRERSVRYPESGRRMVALREWSGVNQAAFCKSVAIAANTWNQIEKGVSRPSIENALRIVSIYKVTLDWIYLGNDAGMPHAMAVELARRLS